MRDLLYDDNDDLRSDLERDWPEARFQGVYDCVHENRLEVDVETDEFEWICWLIRTGWAGISFAFQIYRLSPDPDLHNIVVKAMDKEIPDWRERGEERKEETNSDS